MGLVEDPHGALALSPGDTEVVARPGLTGTRVCLPIGREIPASEDSGYSNKPLLGCTAHPM